MANHFLKCLALLGLCSYQQFYIAIYLLLFFFSSATTYQAKKMLCNCQLECLIWFVQGEERLKEEDYLLLANFIIIIHMQQSVEQLSQHGRLREVHETIWNIIRPVLMAFMFQISLPRQNLSPPKFCHYCIIKPLFNKCPEIIMLFLLNFR